MNSKSPIHISYSYKFPEVIRTDPNKQVSEGAGQGKKEKEGRVEGREGECPHLGSYAVPSLAEWVIKR